MLIVSYDLPVKMPNETSRNDTLVACEDTTILMNVIIEPMDMATRGPYLSINRLPRGPETAKKKILKNHSLLFFND